VKLSDLASIVGPRKQPVMRDRYFQAVRPLSEYTAAGPGERFHRRLNRSRSGQAGRIETISVLLQTWQV
jgi:hypothetical protein